MKFYLGAWAYWLGKPELDGIPLFVSHNTLKLRKKHKPAKQRWALDSGGFTELSKHGKWTVTPEEYIYAVRRYKTEIGQLDWAAPQDLMCEPWMLNGRTVNTHQNLTVDNYCELTQRAPDLDFIPVLQGWDIDEYVRCDEMYLSRGVDLRKAPVVGVGSVCRRQATSEIEEIFRVLHGRGLRLHGFGVKVRGARKYAQHLASSDSFAWSYNARKNPPLPDCEHPRCNNCPKWALRWRQRLLDQIDSSKVTL